MPTRCWPSPGRARRWAATRRCSPWASARGCAIPAAREWLDEHGYGSTVDYLVAMCGWCATRPGCSPTPTPAPSRGRPGPAAGRLAIAGDDARVAATACDPRVAPRRARQDPERRLATLEAAGELAIPFTTGILSGIGESRRGPPRRARGHRRQPRAPRPRAGGHRSELPAQGGHGDASGAAVPARTSTSGRSPWPVCCCRAAIHLQAPPNLSDDFGRLLDAGIDDWGGVSPVTAGPRQPRATLAGDRSPARGHRGRGLLARAPAHDLPRVRADSRALAGRRCASRCSTAPTPKASGGDRATPGTRGRPTPRRRACVPAPARAGGAGRRGAGRCPDGPGGRRRRDRHAVLGAAARRWPRWPKWPTNCAGRPWATS